MFTATFAFMRKMCWILALGCFITHSGLTFFSRSTAQASEKKEKSAKGGGKKGKKPAEEGEKKDLKEKVKDDQAKYQITNNYVHYWEPLTPLRGARVENPDKVSIYEPHYGDATVVVFLASWCLPCQHIIGDLLKLEKDFNTKNTRFVYVFTQDEAQDALGFVKTYAMNDAAHGGDHIIGSDEIQKAFHYPPLPSYYIADRHGWLCMRSLQATKKDVSDVREFLELQTSF